MYYFHIGYLCIMENMRTSLSSDRLITLYRFCPFSPNFPHPFCLTLHLGYAIIFIIIYKEKYALF